MTHAVAYPAFEAAMESGDKAELLRLYDAARTQLARAEALNRGYELALSVRAQEREAVERALIPAGTALLNPPVHASPKGVPATKTRRASAQPPTEVGI